MTHPEVHRELSSQIVGFAQALRDEGRPEGADTLIRAAAEIELLSPELQQCWGGPLNGQAGRAALLDDIIRRVPFDIVLETGTYRGITTAWFADHFTGPVRSCEAEVLYHLQAERRLEGRPDVALEVIDSRLFLKKTLAALDPESRVLIYLDAHWKDDLPLAEELQIVMEAGRPAVVVIDDFRVPDDPGYKYDDYGPGKVLDLDVLRPLDGRGWRIFFPSLPSDQENGAVRGACVLSKAFANDLEGCPGLRGDTWHGWKMREAAEAARMERKTMSDLLMRQQEELLTLLRGERDNQPGGAENARPPLGDVLTSMTSLLHGADQRMRHQADQFTEFRNAFSTFLEQADERRELGRSLVKQKARNLELQRQIHDIEEELHTLRHAADRPEQGSAPPSAPIENEAAAAVSYAHVVLTGAARSRALRLVSLVSPRLKRAITGAEAALARALKVDPAA